MEFEENQDGLSFENEGFFIARMKRKTTRAIRAARISLFLIVVGTLIATTSYLLDKDN